MFSTCFRLSAKAKKADHRARPHTLTPHPKDNHEGPLPVQDLFAASLGRNEKRTFRTPRTTEETPRKKDQKMDHLISPHMMTIPKPKRPNRN